MFVSYFYHYILIFNAEDLFNSLEREICLKLITLHLPEPYLNALDQLVDSKYYPNRAEAIRVAIRDMLALEVWEKRNHV